MMSQFQTRAQDTLGEQRRAHARAQGDDQFDPVALNDRIAVHCAIVGHPHRLAPALFQRLGQRETNPSLGQGLRP